MTLAEIQQEITDEELRALTNAIRTRYGIDFTNYESKSLKRGFARLIGKRNMGSLLDLWRAIMKDREFFKDCIDDLTVNLTELFRNADIWQKLNNDIIPTLRQNSQIDIWHAGCSTGEEVYSMAYVLKLQHMLNKSRLLATDISSSSLKKAEKGRYTNLLAEKYRNGLMSMNPHARPDEMFTAQGDHIQIRPDLRRQIEFRYHNLVSESMSKPFDFIFCRNVMIYFDDELKMKVLQLFHQALKPSGYFIIGYYDKLPEQSKDLFQLHDPTTRIYVKRTS